MTIARFYGQLWGRAASEVSRIGSRDSGIRAYIRGWDLGATVRMFVNDNGNDELVVVVNGGSNNPNVSRVVFRDEHGKEQYINIESEFRIVLEPKTKIELDLNN